MNDRAKLRDLTHFYATLDRPEQGVGGVRRLSSSDGRMDWPTRGACFFFEPGEVRTDSGDGPRVVRVGTHALTPAANRCVDGLLSIQAKAFATPCFSMWRVIPIRRSDAWDSDPDQVAN